MSQQADPTIVHRPGQPPLVSKPLPLKDQVALYFRYLKTNHVQTKQLVHLKTKRASRPKGGYPYCGHNEQDEIFDAAFKHSLDVNHRWPWNPENVGRYIASGLTQPADLYLAIGISAEDIQNTINGPEPYTPERVAEMEKSDIYKAAEERVMENRIAFPQQAAYEDQIRKGIQAMSAPPPLTPDELAAHHHAVGVAAIKIQEKK